MKLLLSVALALASTALPANALPLDPEVTAAGPWVGKVINVAYPGARFQLEFKRDGTTMSWISLDDPSLRDTVRYTSRQVKPGIYLLNWHEPSYTEDAFQFQDWTTKKVHTVLVPKNPGIDAYTGTFTVIGSLP